MKTRGTSLIPLSLMLRSFATLSRRQHDIKAGIILKRIPIVLRQPTDYEIAHHRYERHESYLKDAPYRPDFFESERIRRTPTASSLSDEDVQAQEAESKRENAVQYGDRSSSNNDSMQTLHRHLDRTLYLVVRKPRSQYAWQFPQGHVNEQESLREAAERELKEECGQGLRSWFVGHAPVAHHTYAYPEQQQQQVGCNIFFMKSHYLGGDVAVDGKEVVEHAWLTKEELPAYLDPAYFEAVKDALADQ